MRREKALDTIKEFPQEFELEDLIEKLVFFKQNIMSPFFFNMNVFLFYFSIL